jgi:hypothetical protein
MTRDTSVSTWSVVGREDPITFLSLSLPHPPPQAASHRRVPRCTAMSRPVPAALEERQKERERERVKKRLREEKERKRKEKGKKKQREREREREKEKKIEKGNRLSFF